MRYLGIRAAIAFVLVAIMAMTFLILPPSVSAQGVQASFYLSPVPARFYASGDNYNEPARAVHNYASPSGETLHVVTHIWSNPGAAHQRYLQLDASNRDYGLRMTPIPHGGYADEGGSEGAKPGAGGNWYTVNYRVGSVLILVSYFEPYETRGGDVRDMWQEMVGRARLAPYR